MYDFIYIIHLYSIKDIDFFIKPSSSYDWFYNRNRSY